MKTSFPTMQYGLMGILYHNVIKRNKLYPNLSKFFDDFLNAHKATFSSTAINDIIKYDYYPNEIKSVFISLLTDEKNILSILHLN